MNLIETTRLVIRHLTPDDAAFLLELLNEPDFIYYIGDRGVRTLDDAVQYVQNGPAASYERNGFGLYAVVLKESGTPIGMCGLIKRDTLDDVDIGFAFLERYRAQGYGYESASAVMDYGRNTLKIPRIIAITSIDNEASRALLEKIGLKLDKVIQLKGYEGDTRLFVPRD